MFHTNDGVVISPFCLFRFVGAGLDFTGPRPRIEAAGPFPRVGAVRVAGPHGDGAGLNVAVVDVPAIGAVGRAAAG